MGLRFFRRVKLFPGVSLNFSKNGVSVTFGRRGFKFTVGKNRKQITIGLPGTGVFYTKRLSKKKKTH